MCSYVLRQQTVTLNITSTINTSGAARRDGIRLAGGGLTRLRLLTLLEGHIHKFALK